MVMETTDKQNSLSNGIRFELLDVKEDDLNLCFDFKNFSNLMAVVEGREDEFRISFTYIREQNLGMSYLEKTDNSERYYLMSKMEN
jgi:hypothetical protein